MDLVGVVFDVDGGCGRGEETRGFFWSSLVSCFYLDGIEASFCLRCGFNEGEVCDDAV